MKNQSINAGCKALPALANIVQVMQQTQVGHILSKDELPVSLLLTVCCRFKTNESTNNVLVLCI